MSAHHQVRNTPSRGHTPTDDKQDFFYKYRDEAVFHDKKSIEEAFSYFDRNQ
jgi:hypothetical protein